MLFQVRCKHFITVTLLARKNQKDAHQRHLTCFYFYLFKIAATTVCLDNLYWLQIITGASSMYEFSDYFSEFYM